MEKPQEDEAKVGKHWLCKCWRQCENEAKDFKDFEQLPLEVLEEDEDNDEGDQETVGPTSEQQRLWHLFQVSATSVAQLYKGSECPQSELSMWDPFQNAATALTNLYKESGDARQQSFNLGVKVGYQRRIKDVLAWAKKGQSTILREDLISFLCGKVPPDPPPVPNTPHLPPPYIHRVATESSSSLDFDLQPFQEAIHLQDFSHVMPGIALSADDPVCTPTLSSL